VQTVTRFFCVGLFMGLLGAHVWADDDSSLLAPGVAFPPVSVGTNKAGVPVHRFAMTPVITNINMATNDIARLTARLAEIDAGFKDVATNALPLKTVMRENFAAMAGVVTNYVPRDDEGKKIKERVVVLEAELKGLRQQLEKRMFEDPAYQQVKEKLDAGRQQIKKLEERQTALRSERSAVASQVWQLQTLIERAEKEAKAKAVEEAKAQRESAPKTTP
jgi:chromosome segregation ATPase